MSRYEFLVLTRAAPGREDEFNRWYDQQHLPDVLAVPGIVSARRFKVHASKAAAGQSLPEWQYAAIYIIECEDPASVLEDIARRAGTERMAISEAMDRSTVATYLLGAIPSNAS